MAIAVNILSRNSSITQGVDIDIQYNLEQIREFIYKFKPKSALAMIERLEKELNKAGKPIPAELNYLHGLSLLEIGNKGDEALNQLSLAYENDNRNKNYIKGLMKAYFFKEDDNKCKELLTELLELDKFDPFANALNCFYKDPLDIHSVIKLNTKNYQVFKGDLALFYALRKNSKSNFDNVFIEEALNPLNNSFSIDFENKTYAFIYANYRLSNVILCKDKFLFDEIPEGISLNKDLKPAVDFLDYVIKHFEDTEKYTYYVSYRCFLACGKYIITPNQITLNNFRNEFDKLTDTESQNSFIHLLLTAYTQLKQYDEAVTLANQYPLTSLCLFIQSYAYFRLNDLENCYKSGLSSFEKENILCIELIGNFITFQFFYDFPNEKKEAAYHELEAKFVDENIQKIAKLFSLSHNLPDEEISELAEFIFNYKENDYKMEVITLLSAKLQKYELSNKLIKNEIDFFHYSKLYDAYILNSISLNSNLSELLELLERRRTFGIKPEAQFLAKEIELLHLTFEFEQILLVANLGLETFNEQQNINYFAYQKLLALYNLNEKKGLKTFIDEYHTIFQQADFEEIKHIISIFAHVGCFGYLMDKVFDEAMKGDYDAKQIYFSAFSTLSQDNTPFKHEDIVINGSWVELLNLRNNQKEIKEVSCSNAFLKSLFEKTIGERLIKTSFNGEEEFQITGIFNKYLGLYRKICLEANSIDSFLSSFHLPEEETTKTLNKMFMEKLGKEGDEEEKMHKEYQEKYKRGEISFYEICKLCRENPIQAYWYICGHIKEFKTIPAILYQNIGIKKESNFILDFSTIPLLYEISKKNKKKFDVHFSTSSLVLLKYQQYLEELKSSKDNSLSLHVTSERVEPIFQSKEQTNHSIKYVQNLIKWIKQNCKIEHVRDKLDIVNELSKSIKIKNINEDFLFNYFIDIVLLKENENAVLVTDDLIYQKNFNGGLIISSNYFLQLFFQEKFSDKVLPTLLERNYVGITVDFNTLKNSYLLRNEKPDLYEISLKCINSLNSFDLFSFEKACMLIRLILNDNSLNFEEKRNEIRRVLTHLLSNNKLKEVMAKEFASIHQKFMCFSSDNIELILEEFQKQIAKQ